VSSAFPYLQPPPDVITAGSWSRTVVDGADELPSEMPEWDYDTVLELRRPVRIDGLRARRASGLGEDAELDLAVVWTATSSALRGRAWRVSVPEQDGYEVDIAFRLPGAELGGRLDLRTSLTLRSSGGKASVAAPSRPGSVLWRDRSSVILQGDAVLFPLAVHDFHDLAYPTGAAWHLELGHDLDAAALGSILLLANSRREAVTQALAAAGNPSDADRRVLSTIRSEVLRALVERAIVDEEFDPDVDYPVGSVGALLAAVLRATFPETDLQSLRRQRAHEPILFTTRIQAATDLLVVP
jgi:hypothetical protein